MPPYMTVGAHDGEEQLENAPPDYRALIGSLNERSKDYLRQLQGRDFGYQHLKYESLSRRVRSPEREKARPPASVAAILRSSSMADLPRPPRAFASPFDSRRVSHVFTCTKLEGQGQMPFTKIELGYFDGRPVFMTFQ